MSEETISDALATGQGVGSSLRDANNFDPEKGTTDPDYWKNNLSGSGGSNKENIWGTNLPDSPDLKPDDPLYKRYYIELINVFVSGNGDGNFARKLIDTLKEETKKNLMNDLLPRFISYWKKDEGKMDLKEQYQIYNLGLDVIKDIPMEKANEGDDKYLAKKIERIWDGKPVPVYHNTVRIVGSFDTPPKPIPVFLEQAKGMKDFTNEWHYKKEKDTTYKVDLDGKYSPNLIWYGPNNKFKVLAVNIYQGVKSMYPNGDLHGCSIDIQVLPTETEKRHCLRLVHFTAIHKEIYDGAGTGIEFEPGTFLGMTIREIGWQDGVHLHISAGGVDEATEDSSFDRKKIYKLWSGKDV